MNSSGRRELKLDAIAAYHEAGHAVAAVALGRGVRSLTIVSMNGPDGEVLDGALTTSTPIRNPNSQHDSARLWRAQRELLVIAAGPAAHARYTRRSTRFVLVQAPCKDDWNSIAKLLVDLGRSKEIVWCGPEFETEGPVHDIEEGLDEIMALADILVRCHWSAVKLLARELIEKRTLTGKQIRQIVAPHLSKEDVRLGKQLRIRELAVFGSAGWAY